MSEFICREMTIQQRETARNWLSTIAGKPFPADFFPDTGVACLADGVLACVIPVYLELSTNVAVLGFCMLNPQLSARIRHQAADHVIRYALQYVKSLGKRHVLTLFGNRAVNKIADRIGFASADKNVEEKYCIIV